MSERSSAPSARPMRSTAQRDVPPADIVDFIRFCYRRRRVGWPDIYDEMCAVAARREFRGWGQDELAERGITFTLFEMPRLSAWTREVLAGLAIAEEGAADGTTRAPSLAPRPVPG